MGARAAKVMVVGATGWTGRLVAERLHARGFSTVLSGRRRDALAALAAELPGATVRCLPSLKRRDLADALQGIAVVVSCAGPSTELGLDVVDAAIEAGADYIDITGEESFVRRLYGTRDGAASDAGVIVAPAFAGKGALGDWAASVAIGEGGWGDEAPLVAIAYAHTSAGFVRPSPGSALSAAGQGFIRAQERRMARLRRDFDFPPPFGRGEAVRVPGAEDISVPRHTAAIEASTYVSIDPGRLVNALWNRAFVGAYLFMPAIATALRSTPLRGALARLPSPVDDGGPSFAAAVDVHTPRARQRLGVVAMDAYSVTSEIVAYGVERLVSSRPPLRGVLAPSQIVSARTALSELSRRRAIDVLQM